MLLRRKKKYAVSLVNLNTKLTSFLLLETTRLAVTIIRDQVHILSEPLPPLRLCRDGSVR